jgi:hypothetical protein
MMPCCGRWEAELNGLRSAPLARVLERVDSIWSPACAPHHLLLGGTGAGKSTRIKDLLGLARDERVLLIEPKRGPDVVYEGPPGDPFRWGKPVSAITQMFGYDGEPGGGPAGLWYRLTGNPDRTDTARRFAAALDIVANEGHVVLIFDDVKEICRQLRLTEQVESILNLGRSAGICAVLATTEVSYVAGRSQGAMVWVGFTGGGLDAAKAAAGLLGWRGRERQDVCASMPRYGWIYQDHESGGAGPVLVT